MVTHFFDGPVGMAAACELALSLAQPPLACGLAPHDERAPLPLQLASRTRCVAVAAPGLGFGGRPPC